MSKRHAREHGRILSVDEETLGSVLVADAASGATTLTVDDAAEFEDDGSGGWLSVNDQVIEYDTVDDDAGTIHLKTALTAAADDGDPVYVWSKLYDTVATVKTALVMVDGDDENTDPIHAVLADAVQDLPEGLRGKAGESCTLARVSDDEWEVTAVGGRPTTVKGLLFYDKDFHVITAAEVAAGSVLASLTHEPRPRSVHVRAMGAPQEPSQYAVDEAARTVTIPLAGWEPVGGRIWFMYVYLKGATPKTLNWESGGWRYLQTSQTGTTDRSAVAFDDSGWNVGRAPFGRGAHTVSGETWPTPRIDWPIQTALWVRHDVPASAGQSGTIDVRIDNIADVYWNGEKLGTIGAETSPSTAGSVNVPAAKVLANNVLAIRAQDDVQQLSGDVTYIDARFTQD